MNNRRKLVIALGAGAVAAPFGSVAQQHNSMAKSGAPTYFMFCRTKLQRALVPRPPASDPLSRRAGTQCRAARRDRARSCAERVFDLDLEHCPQCGGDLKIIAAIEEPAVIVKILTHLGLPARAPPRSPARPLAFFQAA